MCTQSSVNSVRSVRDKTPQRVVCVSSHRVGVFSFSQNYTDEQNTQGFTGTLSQPITQNLTAIFGSNALCSLYAGGLLCARNVRQKGSVNSVCSVRDKTPHYEYPTIFLSQKITEEQNTQGFTETLSQPITQNITANFS